MEDKEPIFLATPDTCMSHIIELVSDKLCFLTDRCHFKSFDIAHVVFFSSSHFRFGIGMTVNIDKVEVI